MMSNSKYILAKSDEVVDKEHLSRRNYFDQTGVLRFERLKVLHDPKRELETVIEYEQKFIGAQETVYIIHMPWLSNWMNFVQHGYQTPGKITNYKLTSKKGKVKQAALYNKHWRSINKDVWTYLLGLYGGGPTITVRNSLEPLTELDEIKQFMDTFDLSRNAKVYGMEHGTSKPYIEGETEVAGCLPRLHKKKLKREGNAQIEDPMFTVCSCIPSIVNMETLCGSSDFFAKAKSLDEEAKLLQHEAYAAKNELMEHQMKTKRKYPCTMMRAISTEEECMDAMRRFRGKITERDAVVVQCSATRIQNTYRSHISWTVVNSLLTEARRVRAMIAARLINRCWRRKAAINEMHGRRRDKKRCVENGAAVTIQTCVRYKLACQNHRKLRRPFYIRVLRTSGQSEKVESGNVFVIVTAHEPVETLGGPSVSDSIPHRRSRKRQSILDILISSSKPDFSTCPEQISMYRSKFGGVNKDSERLFPPIFWNELVCVSGCNGFSTLVFTVLGKKNPLSGAYPFYGQMSKSIRHFDLWSDHKALYATKLPMGPAEVPIIDENGRQMMMEAPVKLTGELWVDFISTPACGSISSQCDRFTGRRSSDIRSLGSKWKPTWAVLTILDGLQFYDSSSRLNKIEEDGYFQVEAGDISDVHILSQFDSRTSVLEIKMKEGTKSIYLHFSEHGDAHLWQLKLKVVNSRARSVLQKRSSHTPRTQALFYDQDGARNWVDLWKNHTSDRLSVLNKERLAMEAPS